MLPWLSLALFQLPAPPGSPLEQDLEKQWGRAAEVKGLDCAATKHPARLGFDFRYWTGIDYEIGLAQFAPLQPERRVFLLMRVTPEGKPTRHFVQWRPLPDAAMIPAEAKLNNLAINVGGGVHLGEGKYKLESMVMTLDGRGCKSHWDVEAKKTAQPLRQDPLTVETRRGSRNSAAPAAKTERIVVVLNADTWGPRRTQSKLGAWDRGVLLDSLGSLAESWPSAEIAVYLLHLESGKLLYSSQRFERGTLRAMAESIDKLQTGVVDFKALQQGAGGFLAAFLEKHAAEWEGRDAVIFLGPAWRYRDRLPAPARKKLSWLPRTYHLALGFPGMLPDNLFKQFVASQGGKVSPVTSPQDLARAIKRILERRTASPTPQTNSY